VPEAQPLKIHVDQDAAVVPVVPRRGGVGSAVRADGGDDGSVWLLQELDDLGRERCAWQGASLRRARAEKILRVAPVRVPASAPDMQPTREQPIKKARFRAFRDGASRTRTGDPWVRSTGSLSRKTRVSSAFSGSAWSAATSNIRRRVLRSGNDHPDAVAPRETTLVVAPTRAAGRRPCSPVRVRRPRRNSSAALGPNCPRRTPRRRRHAPSGESARSPCAPPGTGAP
jgi:hypothetical protein